MCPARGAGSAGRSMARSKGRRPSPAVADVDEDHLAECSCKACSAALLADCVAVCCCPCALVSLLATAFLKLPWVVGKRCLRSLRKKRELRKVRAIRKKEKTELEEEMGAVGEVEDREAGEGRGSMTTTSRSDAEKVWEELQKMGHLGFGRVSVSTPPVQAGAPG